MGGWVGSDHRNYLNAKKTRQKTGAPRALIRIFAIKNSN